MSGEGNELVVCDGEIQAQAITPKRRSILTISTEQLSRLKTLAEMMSSSVFEYSKNGKSGKLTSSDIFIKMLKGIEVGLEPIASLDLIDIIQGKPTLKPQGMLALAWGSGQMEVLKITDDGTACAVTMKRQGTPAHTESFSIDDAKSMGLSNRDSWKKQPTVMRKWRAVSAACRIVFPDIIQGMYIPEEIAPPELSFDDNGEVQEVVQEMPQPEPKSEEPEIKVLDCYFQRYVIDGKKKWLEFTADPDPELGFPFIRCYGRSSTFKGMLNKADPLLYSEMRLDDYGGASATTTWRQMDRALRISYKVKGDYNDVHSIELADLEY